MNRANRMVVGALVGLAVTAVLAVARDEPAPDRGASNATVSAATPAQLRPKLLDLGAGRCIPCKMMAPVLEELKKEHAGRLDVEFVDVWKTPEAAKKYGIGLIPTQIFYDTAGKELFRHEGFWSKADILAKWQELGIRLKDNK